MKTRHTSKLAALAVITGAILFSAPAQAADFSKVPGTVVAHSPASSEKYIGSPSLCELPDGSYVASHDFFGPKSDEKTNARTSVYLSKDRGKTWKKISETNQFWSNLFWYEGALYLMGARNNYGDCVIRKSTDSGKTWTEPSDENTGLLIKNENPKTGYHTAPMPMLIAKGRIWRAMEFYPLKAKWGLYDSFVMSAENGADLLKASSWRKTNSVPFPMAQKSGAFSSWLEGNVIETPDGKIRNILRAGSVADDTAAVVEISDDGETAEFKGDFARLPGSSKKFAIRYDEVSKKYYALSNAIAEEFWTQPLKTGQIRNTLALISSENPTGTWKIERVILQAPDAKLNGFQYVDWLFDGDDIVFLSRTAFFDGEAEADNQHNANFLTFHRIQDFRGMLSKGKN